ncbi:MAG TPA: ABC transporter ATP-binding protein [Planctomycetota bacterium]|nr:ABC transporter ATP-binding protein [Planctomycetota bacterium]
MEPLLVANNLTKVFHPRFRARTLTAINDLSLTINRGDIFGFLGPNGAGKSTTIRMILGLIHPTAGSVEIGGCDVLHDRSGALRKVGAFVEAPSFYPYLTGRKNLEIFSGLSGGVSDDEMERVIELVGLKGRENDFVKVYSHGMRQRLGLAACLLPKPELLVLDEPTDGLDPHGIRNTRELIIRLAREEQLTIFLSSHLLSEVENLCNRVAFLDHGSVILEGALEQIEREHRRLEVRVDDAEAAAKVLRENFGFDARVNADANAGDSMLLGAGLDSASINSALVHAGITVRALTPEVAWLDRLFLDLTTAKV